MVSEAVQGTQGLCSSESHVGFLSAHSQGFKVTFFLNFEV